MSNFLVIPNGTETKRKDIRFLFPLKDFCVGFQKEYSLEEIPKNSYLYLNRILENEDIVKLEMICEKFLDYQGIVFEDLGVYEVLKEKNIFIEKIFFPMHASCSSFSVNTFLKDMDSVVISPDITEEEVDAILHRATKEVSIYLYGPYPYLYSRRKLLTNYAKNFNLDKVSTMPILEPIHQKKFVLKENEYGTVCFDAKELNQSTYLQKKNVKYFIVNLDWSKENIDVLLEKLEHFTPMIHTMNGFQKQKTIYRLPPKDGVL